jgi:hypothetical protein
MARSGIVASFVPRLRDYDGSGAACDAFGKPLHNRLGLAAIQVSVSFDDVRPNNLAWFFRNRF